MTLAELFDQPLVELLVLEYVFESLSDLSEDEVLFHRL